MSSLYGSICLSDEIWKDIKGYEGLYQISSLGRVKSLKRYVRHSKGGMKIVNESIKGTFRHQDGRERVELSKNGVNKKFFVYRLIAEAFIPNPNGYKEVNHKDENPANSSIDNLEWCNHLYNMNYGTRTERASLSKNKGVGMYHPDTDVLMMAFVSVKEASDYMDVSKSSISNSCRNKQDKVKGYKFKFL